MSSAIGMDIGGSSTKVALVSQHGEVLADERVPLVESDDAITVLTPCAEAVDRLRAWAAERAVSVRAIGCGVPGYFDPTRQRVALNNVRALDGFPLGPWLRERLTLPVVLDNDACMAAMAETLLARGVDEQRVLFVTVGSGIGVALVADGAIVRLMYGVTGDASHIVVDHASAERCPVGCRGCLETAASARAIARAGVRAARDGSSSALAAVLHEHGEVSGADVCGAAANGDATATAIIEQGGRWLGVGLASWAAVYAPDLVLLGGGVAQAGEQWLAAATHSMHEVGMPFFVDKIRVRRAGLGNRAGVIGAALVALRETDVT